MIKLNLVEIQLNLIKTELYPVIFISMSANSESFTLF